MKMKQSVCNTMVEQYNSYVQELNKAFLSNSEAFDKYAFTMSSTFFAVSVAFIDKVISLDLAKNLLLLYGSWVGFCAVIIISLASFLISDAGLEDFLRKAESHFSLNGRIDLVFNNKYNKLLKVMQYSVFVLITLSLLSMLCFIISNVKG